jgi:hypothetical protein
MCDTRPVQVSASHHKHKLQTVHAATPTFWFNPECEATSHVSDQPSMVQLLLLWTSTLVNNHRLQTACVCATCASCLCRELFTSLYDYPKFGTPFKRGSR